MSKPVIGIIAKHANEDKLRLNTFIRDEVEQAIFDNGGVAIGILPPNEGKVTAKNDWYDNLTTTEKHNIYEQINLCDGIILQGGAYADEYECFIAKYCYEYDIPILGICAGKHNLVRAIGGTIEKIGNENHESEEEYVHSIMISEDSKFYEIIGKNQIMVNSRHVRKTNFSSLKASAYAPDGVIEVEEAMNKRFYLGVQFHPESLYKKDKDINKIFTYFISVCEKFKNEKNN